MPDPIAPEDVASLHVTVAGCHNVQIYHEYQRGNAAKSKAKRMCEPGDPKYADSFTVKLHDVVV